MVYVERPVRDHHRGGVPKTRFPPAFGTPNGIAKAGYNNVNSYVEDRGGYPVVIQSYRRRNSNTIVPYVHHDLFDQPDRYRKHYRTVHRAYRNLHLQEINADNTIPGKYLKRFLHRERNAGLNPPLDHAQNNNHALNIPLAQHAFNDGNFNFDVHNIPDAGGNYPLPNLDNNSDNGSDDDEELGQLLDEMA